MTELPVQDVKRDGAVIGYSEVREIQYVVQTELFIELNNERVANDGSVDKARHTGY